MFALQFWNSKRKLRACETRFQCVSLAPLRAPLKPSLSHSIVFQMLETRSQCVSLAPPRRPLRPSLSHSIVFHETHLVCLSPSAGSATEAISLTLHSVPRVFRNTFSMSLLLHRERYWSYLSCTLLHWEGGRRAYWCSTTYGALCIVKANYNDWWLMNNEVFVAF